MILAGTISAFIAAAIIFGWAVPLANLFAALQPLIVAQSIMIAAVLVRLNRGMPALDWKALKQDERTELTSALVNLTREYVAIIAINGVALIGFITLTVVGKDKASEWPNLYNQAVAAAIGGLAVLCVTRMAYVVWRDFDIVTLQKRVIDAVGEREEKEKQEKLVSQNLDDIRSAELRKFTQNEPRAWS